MQERRQRMLRIGLLTLGGLLVVCGAAGGAAVYIGPEKILGLLSREVDGVDCRIAATIRDRDADGLWVRQFIVTEPVDDRIRILTALRVAQTLHEAEKAHLVQVSVLDPSGPVTISDMRGRAIGAQVTSIPGPVNEVEKQAGKMSGYAVQGDAGLDGEFHGLRVEFMPEDLVAMSGGFGDVTGCSEVPAVKSEPES
jgi:hypothetical protein